MIYCDCHKKSIATIKLPTLNITPFKLMVIPYYAKAS